MPTVAERDVVYKALEPFRFVARFVDDLIAIALTGPDSIERLLSVSQMYAGPWIHGIYPDFLVLKSAIVEGGRVLRALDIEVLPAFTVCGPLFTRLYDKRRQPGLLRGSRYSAFRRLTLCYHPHARSMCLIPSLSDSRALSQTCTTSFLRLFHC